MTHRITLVFPLCFAWLTACGADNPTPADSPSAGVGELEARARARGHVVLDDLTDAMRAIEAQRPQLGDREARRRRLQLLASLGQLAGELADDGR